MAAATISRGKRGDKDKEGTRSVAAIMSPVSSRARERGSECGERREVCVYIRSGDMPHARVRALRAAAASAAARAECRFPSRFFVSRSLWLVFSIARWRALQLILSAALPVPPVPTSRGG